MPNTGIARRDAAQGSARRQRKIGERLQGNCGDSIRDESGEVGSVITGWETLRVSNLKDFESGEWLILSQWIDEPFPDLPQENVPLIYPSPERRGARAVSARTCSNPTITPGLDASRSTARSCPGYRGRFSENVARSQPDGLSGAIQAQFQPDLRRAIAQHDLEGLSMPKTEGETSIKAGAS